MSRENVVKPVSPIPEVRYETAVAHILDVGCRVYREPDKRAAMRGGMGDAAAICDALAELILAENRGHGGKGPPTKRGQELAAIAKRCGDTIWAMRERVEVLRSPLPALFTGGQT